MSFDGDDKTQSVNKLGRGSVSSPSSTFSRDMDKKSILLKSKDTDIVKSARRLLDGQMTIYLNIHELEQFITLLLENTYGKKITDLTQIEISTLRDKIHIKFINRRLDKLDKFLNRLSELNLELNPSVRELVTKLSAIYLGDIRSVSFFFGKKNVSTSIITKNNYETPAYIPRDNQTDGLRDHQLADKTVLQKDSSANEQCQDIKSNQDLTLSLSETYNSNGVYNLNQYETDLLMEKIENFDGDDCNTSECVDRKHILTKSKSKNSLDTMKSYGRLNLNRDNNKGNDEGLTDLDNNLEKSQTQDSENYRDQRSPSTSVPGHAESKAIEEQPGCKKRDYSLCDTTQSVNMHNSTDKKHLQQNRKGLNLSKSFTKMQLTNPEEEDKHNITFMKNLANDIKNKSAVSELNDDDKNKTYVSDLKIASFRLIVGVAYRTFRPGTSIDHTTAKTVTTEPYKFIDLIELIRCISELLLNLKIIDNDHYQHLSRVHDILHEKYNLIVKRYVGTNANVIHHDTQQKKTGYAYGKLDVELTRSINNIKKLGELKNFDIDITPEYFGKTEKYEDAIKDNIRYLNRCKSSLPYIPFRERYSLVFVEHEGVQIEDALIRNSFWYDLFLPLTLRGLSIDTEFDDRIHTLLDQIDQNKADRGDEEIYRNLKADFDLIMDEWFETNYESISTYCRDIPEGYDRLVPKEKIVVKQCWDMIKKYLYKSKCSKLFLNLTESDDEHGIDEYEFSEFGSDILVDVSRYIPFIDDVLGRKYVADNDMTPSLPQYIGPPSWRLLHAIPEIVQKLVSKSNSNKKSEKELLESFTAFFLMFLKTYPCQYCRNHLNNCIVKNSEILSYPLEYLFMDWFDYDDATIFRLNIDEKIRTIVDPNTLRLFLWKFHNAVSSSALNTDGFEIGAVPDSFDPSLLKKDSKLNNLENKTDTEEVVDKSINSRNSDYTSGHWPDPKLLDSESRKLYERAIINLIEHRRSFAEAIIEMHSTNSDVDAAVSHLNTRIKDLVEKIKEDIKLLDHAILSSKVLSSIYGVVNIGLDL